MISITVTTGTYVSENDEENSAWPFQTYAPGYERVDFNKTPFFFSLSQGIGLFIGVLLILWGFNIVGIETLLRDGLFYALVGIPTSVLLVFQISKKTNSPEHLLDLDPRYIEELEQKMIRDNMVDLSEEDQEGDREKT